MSDAAPRTPPDLPTLRTLLGRALRERCPRCGLGDVFVRGFQGHVRCDVCTWRLERSEGHWIGGTEIHMIVCFSLGLALSALGWAATGDLVVGWALGAGVTVLLTPLLYRRSRCVFFALDYLIDPVPDETWGDDRSGPGDDRDDDRRPDFDPHQPRGTGTRPPPASQPRPRPNPRSRPRPLDSRGPSSPPRRRRKRQPAPTLPSA